LKSPLILTGKTSQTQQDPPICVESFIPPFQRESSSETHKMKLSVSIENYKLDGCSEDLLKETWEKAEKLIKSPNGLVSAPGYDGVYVQHFAKQRTSNLPPHSITSTKTGKFTCDCTSYMSFKI
jgi:hypothetical protein